MQVRAWQRGYAWILSEATLAAFTCERREARWREILASPDSARATLVAVAEGRIVGFCSRSTPARDEDVGERTAEIAAAYVDPELWREGIGRALVARTLAELRAGGWEDVVLWVFSENARARRFYECLGFTPDGTEARDEGTGGTPEVRLRTTLGPDARWAQG